MSLLYDLCFMVQCLTNLLSMYVFCFSRKKKLLVRYPTVLLTGYLLFTVMAAIPSFVFSYKCFLVFCKLLVCP